jgi:hypothetical protein
VLRTVAPLVIAAAALQLWLGATPTAMVQFAVGSSLAVLGLLLLFTGIDAGVLPMGRFIGAELPRRGSLWLILGLAFGLGLATTLAEPDVLVLASEVDGFSDGRVGGPLLMYVIAAGVGLFTALGLFRIVRGFSMAAMLTVIYVTLVALSFVAPDRIVPLAYDAGSVTTGVLTAPVVLALGLGITSVLAKRSAMTDGFGLLGLASAGPILVLLMFGWFAW